MLLRKLVLVGVGFAALTFNASAALINGDFETVGAAIGVEGSHFSYSGWTVTGGGCDPTGSNNGPCYTTVVDSTYGGFGAPLSGPLGTYSARLGYNDLDNAGTPVDPGATVSLSQAFTGSAAGNYVLTFDLGLTTGDPIGTDSYPIGNYFQVLVNGNVVDTLTNTAAQDFTGYQYNVSLTGNDTITFVARQDTAGDFFLDNVAFAPATTPEVPEPGTYAMVVGGLGAFAMLRRRK